jgi:succinate dehydrogenase flavin-adding protein (antitoxin of CptAB toxin-antitoxin module)
MKRITELTNELTSDLDRNDEACFIRLLRSVDSQIFDSWSGNSSISDQECLLVMKDIVLQMRTGIHQQQSKDSCVVLLGCGTSGRM